MHTKSKDSVKLVLSFDQGRKKLTSHLALEPGKTDWDDIIRAANWQGALCGVAGGVQLVESGREPNGPHKLFFRGATALVSWTA